MPRHRREQLIQIRGEIPELVRPMPGLDLIRQWLRPVLPLWAEEAISAGRLPHVTLSDFYERPTAYIRGRWVFAGRGWVDPVKEAQAAEMRMKLGISTLEAECAEQGTDWQEQMEQQIYEEQYRRERREALGLDAQETNRPAGAAEPEEPNPGQQRVDDLEERLEALERQARVA